MTSPKYDVGDTAYLRESAAIGFLEVVQISGVTQYNSAWVYSIKATPGQPRAQSLYGDRTSIINGSTLYFTESELIDQCAALALADARAQSVLDSIKAKKANNCP